MVVVSGDLWAAKKSAIIISVRSVCAATVKSCAFGREETCTVFKKREAR